MTREIKPLPQELTELLFESGDRKIVLVEGESDIEVLNEWYGDKLDSLIFHVAGGNVVLRSLLDAALAQSQRKGIFGIIDRDFRDDADVEAALIGGGHLFILRRYSIENYLIEPQAVHDVCKTFHGNKAVYRNAQAAEAEILRLCHVLKPVMATNWVLTENAKTILAFGFDLDDRGYLVNRIAKAVPCNSTDAETKLSEKEAIIETALVSLETAHTRINGKHLLNRLYLVIAKGKGRLDDGHFRRLLRDKVAHTTGIHQDIREIVEKRVLGLILLLGIQLRAMRLLSRASLATTALLTEDCQCPAIGGDEHSATCTASATEDVMWRGGRPRPNPSTRFVQCVD